MKGGNLPKNLYLRQALREEKASPSDPIEETEYTVFALSDFSIYGPEHGDRANDFVPLHRLCVAHGHNDLFFDGIIGFGNVRQYVQRVRFSTLTIEGYGKGSRISEICIQSTAGASKNIWYSLGEPAEEYRRYHEAFLWIAEFAKHFVDYLCYHLSVRLEDLRRDFYAWLRSRSPLELRRSRWLSEYGRQDFRQAFVSYCEFLWKEAYSVDTDALNHPIWLEADPRQLQAIKEEPFKESMTIVTPYAYECFKHMYFQHFLKRKDITNPAVLKTYQLRVATMGFTKLGSNSTITKGTESPQKRFLDGQIRVGSVIAIERDRDSDWKDNSSTWYAYVQGVTQDRCRNQLLRLNVIWLYRPGETILSKGIYLWEKELFFSDHCNCGDADLLTSEALHAVDVEWFGTDPTTSADFFVCQKYCTRDGAYSFRELQQSDFKCPCTNQKSALTTVQEKYKPGDPVLVQMNRVLEPCILYSIGAEVEGLQEVTVQRLKRLKAKIPSARPNELGWTEQICPVQATRVFKKCHIRIYTRKQREFGQIPAPYSRDGTADCWYISAKILGSEGDSEIIEYLQAGSRLPFDESFDPLRPKAKPLLGLDLFCGAGSFGRGLEESGAVEMKYAIDFNKQAMHTYSANIKADDVKLFLGSADDYLSNAMAGSRQDNVAAIGEVEECSAGSPCVGFSNAQPNKQSDMSKKNASMVASVIAFLDFYRPRYGILENVPAMATDIGGQNVFAQVLCALVAMGRVRLFIVCSAPGQEPFNHPSLTHAHPTGISPAKLGKAVNGQPFGERRFEDAYPFNCVTAREATEDLPYIGDSHVQVCIRHPDHRTSRAENMFNRCLIGMIPTTPYGANFITASQMSVVAKPQMDKYAPRSVGRFGQNQNSWRRIRPDGLFSTVTTFITPWDYKAGRTIHWEEHRLLTIEEARRAQGIPEEEVLVGLPSSQWKQIANGVARGVSLALGMAMREAWLTNPEDSKMKRSA
ncbi:S-adenosyl-L-methionine-dependent methyltransferase [Viridothelium virens]|uniref:DNA (cytosine-5-)-methyltransferase n=1 Tax=Viridothelium virens TaxID=1048519 RepID=A0A6A6HHH9_VIRVR|nr:S-adenosyl-L-methionine-dependent methyltransferase [Viridothelium virens]